MTMKRYNSFGLNSEFYDLLDTGDMIGVGDVSNSMFSRLIRFTTRSSISHVAVVVKNPPYHCKGLYILEANSDEMHVHCIPFAFFLAQYKHATFYYRKINFQRSTEFYLNFYHLFNNAIGKPYLMDFLRFALAECASNTPTKVFLSPQKFFCSSLCTYIYKSLAMISKDIDPERITPSEIFEGDIIDTNNISEIKVLLSK